MDKLIRAYMDRILPPAASWPCAIPTVTIVLTQPTPRGGVQTKAISLHPDDTKAFVDAIEQDRKQRYESMHMGLGDNDQDELQTEG